MLIAGKGAASDRAAPLDWVGRAIDDLISMAQAVSPQVED